MTFDLFADRHSQHRESLGTSAFLLRGFALSDMDALMSAIITIQQQAPFEQMTTPGGLKMSAKLTSCGDLGWVSDSQGYRYSRQNPFTGKPWPPMPAAFRTLANRAAHASGFANFLPDTCLMNHYAPGARMSLHQDKNEQDFSQPIVSVSLGMTATFLWAALPGTHPASRRNAPANMAADHVLFGDVERHGKTTKILLHHGDVVVWGGVDRLRFHGIEPVVSNPHPLLGAQRINLTFRKAG